jgi:PBP1b-binding outer membrane lipoprotein LpoB
MKNLVAILTAVVFLTACGNSNTQKCENCNDSTTVACDSTQVDSTSTSVDTASVK